jgi:hypothetical protein
MHGRHSVTKECHRRNTLAGIADYVYGYTTHVDGELLDDIGVHKVQRENTILGKAQASLDVARDMECNAVMLMGNDDYVNRSTVELIKSLLCDHDYIAFSSILFRAGDEFWLWPGYVNHRKGEPAGAGKVVRRDLADAVDWQLFKGSRDIGSDFHVHNILMKHAKSPVFIGVDNCAYLVDVKDNESTTRLRKFTYLRRLNINREELLL